MTADKSSGSPKRVTRRRTKKADASDTADLRETGMAESQSPKPVIEDVFDEIADVRRESQGYPTEQDMDFDSLEPAPAPRKGRTRRTESTTSESRSSSTKESSSSATSSTPRRTRTRRTAEPAAEPVAPPVQEPPVVERPAPEPTHMASYHSDNDDGHDFGGDIASSSPAPGQGEFTGGNQEGYQGINEVDRMCKLHDEFYTRNTDTTSRNISDDALAHRMHEIANDSRFDSTQRNMALLIYYIMKAKVKFGLGIKSKNSKRGPTNTHK